MTHETSNSNPSLAVAILSDSEIFREAVAERIRREAPQASVRPVGTIGQLLFGVSLLLPGEIILVDQRGLADKLSQTIRAIKSSWPTVRVLVVGIDASSAQALEFLQAGETMWIDAHQPLTAVWQAILALAEPTRAYRLSDVAEAARRIRALEQSGLRADRTRLKQLTEREHEIAALVVLGLANKSIARRLEIKLKTVKNHVQHLLEKLQIRRRREVQWALQEGSS